MAAAGAGSPVTVSRSVLGICCAPIPAIDRCRPVQSMQTISSRPNRSLLSCNPVMTKIRMWGSCSSVTRHASQPTSTYGSTLLRVFLQHRNTDMTGREAVFELAHCAYR